MLSTISPRFSTGEDQKERSLKKLAQAFVYPDAKKFDEAREGPNMYQAKLATADSFNKVTAWYGKTLDFNALEGIAFNPGQHSGIRLSVSEDSREPGKTENSIGEARPVSLKVFIKKTNEIVVVAVVSRGKDEKLTHVALTYIEIVDK